MIDVLSVGLFACNRLALPAAQLIEDRRPTAPVGIPAGVCEPRRNRGPTPLRLGPLHIESLGDRWARDREWQGQAPGMPRGLGSWLAGLRRPGLPMVRMGEESGEAGGM